MTQIRESSRVESVESSVEESSQSYVYTHQHSTRAAHQSLLGASQGSGVLVPAPSQRARVCRVPGGRPGRLALENELIQAPT
jgi:hypothetical protein